VRPFFKVVVWRRKVSVFKGLLLVRAAIMAQIASHDLDKTLEALRALRDPSVNAQGKPNSADLH